MESPTTSYRHLHSTDEEMEAHTASECAQGHQARDGIRIQAQSHLTSEPVLLATKTTKLIFWGTLTIEISRKKPINDSQMYLRELGPLPSAFPLSSCTCEYRAPHRVSSLLCLCV